jgi:serine/threonine protein kinase
MDIELKIGGQLEKMRDTEIMEYITKLEKYIHTIHTKKSAEYYNTNYALGLACGILADRKNEQSETYCKKGICVFNGILKIIHKNDFARQALIHKYLGNFFCILSQQKNNVKFCHVSIRHHKKAIQTLKKFRGNFSHEIADININLGNAYADLAIYEKREANCDQAIDCFKKALIEITAENSPNNYPLTQNNLGNAYQLMASVRNGSDNYNLAVAALEEALRFVDPNNSPNLYHLIKTNHQKILNLMNKNWVENRYKNPNTKREFLTPIYEKYETLGEGGYGIVELVFNNEIDAILALKTFRDVYWDRIKERTLFYQEAERWINLGKHPYIVQAHFIEEINGRPYIAMEFIPSSDNGCCTLGDFIYRSSITDEQIASWGIQFCIGMEHAYAHGILSHRDIKPSNILITPQNTLKITDFGLASVIESDNNATGIISEKAEKDAFPECTNPIGTELYRSPEHIQSPSKCDERSDIFSFGIVLYQMISKGGHPFVLPSDHSSSCDEYNPGNIVTIQRNTPIPDIDSPFNRIIHKSLRFQPNERYQHFKDIRKDLQKIFKQITGKEYFPLTTGDLDFGELVNKGVSFDHLGKYGEALEYYDKAISIKPKDKMVFANKAFSLTRLSRYAEALICCDSAIAIDPSFSVAHINKGNAFEGLGMFNEAIACYDKALEIKPWFVEALYDKAMCLISLKKFKQSIECCNTAIEINPKYPNSYNAKGICLHYEGQYSEAIGCYNEAIQLNPFFSQAIMNKGLSLEKIGDYKNAHECFKKVLDIDEVHEEALKCKILCEKYLQ